MFTVRCTDMYVVHCTDILAVHCTDLYNERQTQSTEIGEMIGEPRL
jgi:hypothetical protein